MRWQIVGDAETRLDFKSLRSLGLESEVGKEYVLLS